MGLVFWGIFNFCWWLRWVFFFPFPFNPGKHSTDQTVKAQSVESNTTNLNTNAAPAEQASELAGSRSPPHFHFGGAQRTSGCLGVI